MNPLIDQFTKNLSGCSGCGNKDAIYDTWVKAKETGEKMKFQFVVVVEADTLKQAVNKIPDEFETLQGGIKPETKMSTGTQGSRQPFSSTQTQPTPQIGG